MNSEIRLAELLADAANVSWSVIRFSETRAGASDTLLEGGHRLICSRGDTYFVGVAVLIRACFVKQMISWKAIVAESYL